MTGTGKPILPAGASGLARHLAGLGMALRPSGIAPFPDEAPPGASFTQADLAGGPAIPPLAKGCCATVHFGGIPVEQPFGTVIGPNTHASHHASVP